MLACRYVEFAKHIEVVGFDVNEEKTAGTSGADPTKEVGDEAIVLHRRRLRRLTRTLREARFHSCCSGSDQSDTRPLICRRLLAVNSCLAVT